MTVAAQFSGISASHSAGVNAAYTLTAFVYLRDTDATLATTADRAVIFQAGMPDSAHTNGYMKLAVGKGGAISLFLGDVGAADAALGTRSILAIKAGEQQFGEPLQMKG
jgi:hypothetical protein